MAAQNRDDVQKLHHIAQSIATDVHRITDMLEAQQLRAPSLGANAPSPDFVPSGDAEMENVRRQIIGNARLLANIFSGPRRHLMDLCILPVMSMEFLYRYKIASLVPLEGTIPFSDLSIATGLDESRLTRLIRFLILHQIFEEPQPGAIAHSAASRLLAVEQMSMDFLGHSYEDVLPACSRQVDSMIKSPRGNTVLDCGMTIALGDGKRSLFEVYEGDQARLKRFSGAMEFINARGAYPCVENDLLVNFDWRELGNAKVVDVGGSQGHTSTYIARHAPNLKIIVQDLPSVIDQAQKPGSVSEVSNQLTFQGASFFDRQPVEDADVYLFRFIFHDWPYEKAVEILKAQVPSMKSGSRLVINEAIILNNDQENPYSALISRISDLQMMVALNAKERSVHEWQSLVSDATGSMLKLESAKPTVLVFRKQ